MNLTEQFKEAIKANIAIPPIDYDVIDKAAAECARIAKVELDKLRLVLEEAKNGLQWYREEHPEDKSGADDEMMEKINAVLKASP